MLHCPGMSRAGVLCLPKRRANTQDSLYKSLLRGHETFPSRKNVEIIIALGWVEKGMLGPGRWLSR